MNEAQKREMIASVVKEALIKDFYKLYVREFTTTWSIERILRKEELGIMSLENTTNAIMNILTEG